MKTFFVTLGLVITIAVSLLLALMTGFTLMNNEQLLPYIRVLFLVIISTMLLFIGVLAVVRYREGSRE